jgi:predicted alpha/beta-fold hydrolase
MHERAAMQTIPQHRRSIFIVVAALVILVLTAAVGVGWYFSNMLRQEALLVKEGPEPYDLVVASVGEGTVTLQTADPNAENGAWAWDGIWGLAWADGYGRVGDILSLDGTSIVREFEPLRGTLTVGEPSRLDSFSIEGNPAEALGLDFEHVVYKSELGEYPAWLIPGDRETWAIFVHGWKADQQETLRMLPTVVEPGFPSLVITYRNDEGTPGNPDGFYRFGATEWRDVEAAVQYALDQGASDIMLIGYSMGGAASLNFL